MRNRSRTLGVVAMAIAALAVGACSSGDSNSGGGATLPGGSDSGGSLDATVKIVDNAFEPETVEIKNGGTVTWDWTGKEPHDVKGDDFDSGTKTEGSFKHTYDENGTFRYVCTIHPEMKGTVKVA